VGASYTDGVRIEELRPSELGRIREIDRSESVRFKYVYDRGELRPVEINHQIPTWTEAMIVEAEEMLAPKLAVLGGEFTGAGANQLQMAFLYVSNGYRRRGIAGALLDDLCLRARQRGAEQLYISATETESALGFYLGYGCRLADAVNPALYALEPTDIHLTFDL
jgi:ribosomal protein S18 acetylase RimI-like enzyme